MKPLGYVAAVLLFVILAPSSRAQTRIIIPAGSPEDQALQEITSQSDMEKRKTMLEDFVRKFASNPAAVAYGNWQLAQQAAASGDPQSSLAYGDKALAAMPEVVEILVSQVDVAQQLKDSGKVIDYAVRGAAIVNNLEKTPPPAGVAPQDFASDLAAQKQALQSSYHYIEVAGYNAVTAEPDPRRRMQEVEKYLAAFPASEFREPVATLAIVTLQQMKDTAGLAAFGDKVLAKNPNDIRLLTVLASAYVNDTANLATAGNYARKAIELQKGEPANATDRKLAGVAHSVLGRVLLEQKKFPSAATELKTATTLLHDSPDDLAAAWYYLGFAYAKMERAADSMRALTEAGNIPGPYQQPAQELLAKIKAARSRK